MLKAILFNACRPRLNGAKQLLADAICMLWLVKFGFVAVAATTAASAIGSPVTIASQTKTVNVSPRRDGDVTHFYVENKELCEITMTFEMGLENLKGCTKLKKLSLEGTLASGEGLRAAIPGLEIYK